MARQLDHLLEVGTRPNVTIQIIPFTAGAYGAMSGPLSLFSFPEHDEPDVVYVESLAGMSLVDGDQDVISMAAVWNAALAAALPADKSAQMIRKVRTAL